jgi:hypothetical protein
MTYSEVVYRMPLNKNNGSLNKLVNHDTIIN